MVGSVKMFAGKVKYKLQVDEPQEWINKLTVDPCSQVCCHKSLLPLHLLPFLSGGPAIVICFHLMFSFHLFSEPKNWISIFHPYLIVMILPVLELIAGLHPSEIISIHHQDTSTKRYTVTLFKIHQTFWKTPDQCEKQKRSAESYFTSFQSSRWPYIWQKPNAWFKPTNYITKLEGWVVRSLEVILLK